MNIHDHRQYVSNIIMGSQNQGLGYPGLDPDVMADLDLGVMGGSGCYGRIRNLRKL